MLFHVLATIAGFAILLYTLRDVVLQLFHPSPVGTLSSAVMRGIWSLVRRGARRRPSPLRLAGPTIVVAVISMWTLLLVLGWALIYWPRLPGQFAGDAPFLHGNAGSFVDAMYLSMVTLATLGFGDITPATWQLRLLTPLQAFVGFALLSAGISWVLSIHPVLSRRRALALRVQLARDSEVRIGTSFATADRSIALPLLLSFTEDVAHVRSDLLASPVTYFFDRTEWGASLAAVLPYLHHAARRGASEGRSDEARYASMQLAGSIEYLANVLAEHLPEGRTLSVEEVLLAFARDHRREPIVRTSE